MRTLRLGVALGGIVLAPLRGQAATQSVRDSTFVIVDQMRDTTVVYAVATRNDTGEGAALAVSCKGKKNKGHEGKLFFTLSVNHGGLDWQLVGSQRTVWIEMRLGAHRHYDAWRVGKDNYAVNNVVGTSQRVQEVREWVEADTLEVQAPIYGKGRIHYTFPLTRLDWLRAVIGRCGH